MFMHSGTHHHIVSVTMGIWSLSGQPAKNFHKSQQQLCSREMCPVFLGLSGCHEFHGSQKTSSEILLYRLIFLEGKHPWLPWLRSFEHNLMLLLTFGYPHPQAKHCRNVYGNYSASKESGRKSQLSYEKYGEDYQYLSHLLRYTSLILS